MGTCIQNKWAKHAIHEIWFLLHVCKITIKTNKLSYKAILHVYMLVIIEPQHEISNNVVCATIKALDQAAHMRSLIRAFASRLNILEFLGLKGGCTGSSESTLVKMPTSWKSHVTAQLISLLVTFSFYILTMGIL